MKSTDYLVIGAGASGLAFADALVAEADVDVTIVDRRPGPGGHWLDAYPFVRLHIPSAYYGVNSLPLGEDRIDEAGENAGFYERATGQEVRDYFAEAAARLEQTGRVRVLTRHRHLASGADGEQVRDLATGDTRAIAVRRKVVDARYLEASIPATHRPSFAIAPGTRVVPVNDLPAVATLASSFTVLGGGKTAVDACTWLIDNGVEPDRIRWVRPREAWFMDRAAYQPLEQVGAIIEGVALDAEAGANAEDLDDLFARLEASGRLMRIDPSRPATMYRGTMLNAHELRAARQIEDVVRLGRVRRVEADRIVLDHGEVATSSDVVHVDCTALGLRDAPATPVFGPDRIVLQQLRHLSPCFNAALIGFVEAHRDEDAEKNRLCPPNPYPSSVEHWPGMVSRTWMAEREWLSAPDVARWIGASRLNLLQALPDHVGEPAVQSALERYLKNVGPAVKRLSRLDAAPAQAAAGTPPIC